MYQICSSYMNWLTRVPSDVVNGCQISEVNDDNIYIILSSWILWARTLHYFIPFKPMNGANIPKFKLLTQSNSPCIDFILFFKSILAYPSLDWSCSITSITLGFFQEKWERWMELITYKTYGWSKWRSYTDFCEIATNGLDYLSGLNFAKVGPTNGFVGSYTILKWSNAHYNFNLFWSDQDTI